jgi:ubiquinone biosynthesis protein UbiJ
VTHWERLEERKLDGNDMVRAVLELRGKVEALEHDAQVREAGDTAAYDQLAARIEALEWDEQAEIVNYYSALSAQHQGRAVFHGNSKPTPNPSQIRSSLVERVAATLHAATNSDPNVPANEWEREARAAIREVNAWLRERAGGTRASWLLDSEIEQ